MDRQLLLFAVIFVPAVVLATFLGELMSSSHGEIAQALGNLVGAGLGGGIAVYAANYQVKREFDLNSSSAAEANVQRVRNARILLCAEFATVGRYCIKQLGELSDRHTFDTQPRISGVPKQLSLESIGIGLSELSFEEVTLVAEMRNRLNELSEIGQLYNNGMLGWRMDDKATNLLRVICQICAAFLEISAPRADVNAVKTINQLKRVFE